MENRLNLTERLRNLSEDIELTELDYVENEDEKLSILLKENQKTDVLINDELLLRVEYQEGGFYSIAAYHPDDEENVLDAFDVFPNVENINDETDNFDED